MKNIRTSRNRTITKRIIQMVDKVGKFSEKNAEKAFAKLSKDLVGENISSRFSGSRGKQPPMSV